MDEPATSPDASFAPLVLDSDAAEPRRWRVTDDFAAPGVDTRGFCELGCSGSAQFSAAAWDVIVRRLGDPAQLYVVDLRQESHGFVDGAAVSWYARNNWGALGLGDGDAAALERLRLLLLGQSDELWLARADEVKAGRPLAWTRRARGRVASEREQLALPEGHYLRLWVTDHLRARDEVLDQWVAFVRGLPAGARVHVHCRGGKGRSATFIAFYDMLRNAHAVDLETILTRNRLLSDYDLRALPAAGSAKAPFAPARQELLGAFYRYARAVHASHGGAPVSFSQWRRDTAVLL
jgi:protein-tyrosine phosphatase